MVKHFLSRFFMIVALLCCTVWGGKVYAKIGDKTPVCDGFTASNGFGNIKVPIDWATQEFQVTVDVSDCKFNEDEDEEMRENVLSFGTAPGNTVNQIHVVYTSDNKIDVYLGVLNNKDKEKYNVISYTIKEKKFTFRISKAKGAFIDEDNIDLSITSGTFSANLSDFLFDKNDVYIGSTAGLKLGGMTGITTLASNATYSDIQLEQIVAGEDDPKDAAINCSGSSNVVYNSFWDNYNPTEKTSDLKYFNTIKIDWNTQKLVAKFNVKNCGNDADHRDNVLSVGEGIDTWADNKAHWHFYYAAPKSSSTGTGTGTCTGSTTRSGSLEYVFFDKNNKSVSRQKLTSGFTSDELTIEISKKAGMKINGTSYDSGLSEDEIATNYADLWNMSDIEVGSTQGSGRNHGTIDYVRIVGVDDATTSGNVLSQTNVNSFSSQENVIVQLDRELSNQWWNTFCVPFDIDADLVKYTFGDGVKLRTFDKAEGTIIKFKAVTDGIKAGQPYLLKPEETVEKPTFSGVNLVAPATTGGNPDAVMNEGYGMQGTYGYTEMSTDKTNLFLGDGDRFFYPDGSEGSNVIYGMRAFFIVPAGTKVSALKALVDDETTSIDAIDGANKQDVDVPVYNLQGQRVGNTLLGLRPGIYVQNGKKVVVK